MKTQIVNTQFGQDIKEVMTAVFTHTRSKVMSAADVWNIQRNKRARVQRRFAL